MIWEGYSKIWQLEKLGDGWGWVDGWLVFVNNKDWQGQSIRHLCKEVMMFGISKF